MPEFGNPYREDVKKPLIASAAERLSGYVQAFLVFGGVRLTTDESDALTKVLHAIVRAQPWLEDLVK